MDNRSKPPEGYGVGRWEITDTYTADLDLNIVETAVNDDGEYDSAEDALAACWAHRDAIVAEERALAEKVLRKILAHCDRGEWVSAGATCGAALASYGISTKAGP